MSGKCGSCDCDDKSQCVKKGDSYGMIIVEAENSYDDGVAMDGAVAEHDGKCKCGAGCACVSCTCGH